MFQKKVLVRALAMAFAVSATVVAVAPPAFAQSNTTGNIVGQVSPGTGATVLVEGVSVGGFRREVTPDASGRFQVQSVPVGEYKVSLMRAGKAEQTDTVGVGIGQSAQVSFEALGAQVVQVTGSRIRRIDVSNTNQGAAFSARELERLPVAANIASVIQLAPSTVAGDPRYGGKNAPSFGGASASENSYYINGYPVTNPLTQVGFSSLPFGAVSQAQILTGGYGAEFGRSTGGVVNVTTKSGTDTWEAGIAVSFQPKDFRDNRRNIVYPKVTTGSREGQVRQWLQDDTQSALTTSAYVGGPLIKDKLYMFVAAEQQETKFSGVRVTDNDATSGAVGWQERKLTQPKLLGKLDWNITNDHHLEYTLIRDEPKDDRKYYGFDYATKTHNNVLGGGVTYKAYGPLPIAAETGGNVDILKYTGNFGDRLIVTAVAGRSKIDVAQNLLGYNPAFPLISIIDPAPGINYVSNQTVNDNVLAPGAKNKTSGYRLDLEYKLNNQHTLRGGIDKVKLDSYSGEITPGGIEWRYQSDPCGQPLAIPGSPLAPTNLRSGATCYYVYSHYFKAANPAKVDQSAVYIEDRWQVTKDVLLSLGLRNEQFKNYNEVGQAFVQQSKQIEPRIGAAWDLKGDSSVKLFGNAGRYHLQLPANVAIRGAGASSFLDQYYSYTGVDPATGAPTGKVALGPQFSPDGETGLPKDLGYVAAKNLKSHYQDELAFGFEMAASRALNIGAKVTYRKLQNTLEDWCDPRPFKKWAADHGVNTDRFDGKRAFAGLVAPFSCATINPGVTNTFDLDIDGNGTLEHVVLSPKDMAGGQSTNDGDVMPKASRKYLALDLFAEHPFDGKWYGKVMYTWSRSTGNTEGQLNSDLGQADPAATVSFDYKELMEYSSGSLPNDRTHVIKAFGYYALTPELAFGGNLTVASGRPKTCLGKYPDPANEAGQAYGANLFHYCGADPLNPSAGAQSPSLRGAAGRFPWQHTLDVNMAYKPQALPGFTAKVDVFNLNGAQTEVQRRDRATPANRYGIVEAYTAPRSVKLTASYERKF